MSASAQRCDELLHALAVMLLARIDVALRVDGDAADGEELSRIAAAAAECARPAPACRAAGCALSCRGRWRRTRSAAARRSRTPGPTPIRATTRRRTARHGRAERVLRHDALLDERAVLPEHLNAVAAAIADVDLPVASDLDARDVAERLRRRIVRRIRGRRRACRLLAVCKPVALVGALVCIEDDDAAVAGVGDEHLVGGGVEGDRGRTVQRRLAVGAVHLARRADLQQELAVA